MKSENAISGESTSNCFHFLFSSFLLSVTGVNMSNLSFLENGQRNAHILTLKSIADVLGKDVKDFI